MADQRDLRIPTPLTVEDGLKMRAYVAASIPIPVTMCISTENPLAER